MRKSSPFVSIPTVPTTVSGQWLAFSHMANHYRKILNVKPRVNSNAPKFNFMDPAPKPSPKLKKAYGTQFRALRMKDEPNILKSQTSTKQKAKKALPMTDVDFKNLANAYSSPRIPKKVNSTSTRDLIFAPSSGVRQSFDDLISESDFDLDIDGVSTMGIAEKIQLFLDKIQDYDLNNNRTGPPLKPGPGLNKTIRSRDELNESYLARHSKCFIPSYSSGKQTRQINKPLSTLSKTLRSSTITSTPRTPTKQIQKTKSKPVFNSEHNIAGKQNVKSLNAHGMKMPVKPKTARIPGYKEARQILETGIGNSRIVESTRTRNVRRCKSPGSVSAGTIRGSDELTEARLLPKSTNVQLNRHENHQQEQRIRIEDQEMSSNWLREKVDKGLIRINNAYFQLGNGTSSTPAFGLLNNKDSSRDSAYGFSSGESRITTRESTPEQIPNSGHSSRIKTTKKLSPDMGKYKSSLSTVASSTIQDSPASSLNKYKSKMHEQKQREYQKSKTSVNGTDWMSDNRYLDFLTEVTDDVVSRGIYTNRGLKALFTSHIQKNPELEVDKMMHMLNRLRMDVGVPMDDTLNQLEFGYGSVKYSVPPFFSKYTDVNGNPTNMKPSTNDSEPSIHELHHRQPKDYHSTDDASSCHSSVVNGESYSASLYAGNSPLNVATSQSSKESNTSLTDSEITNALKEVGFDSDSTLDILKIITHKNKPKKKSAGLPQHQTTFTTNNKSKSLKKSNRSNSTGSC